jgi:hypothetical protein
MNPAAACCWACIATFGEHVKAGVGYNFTDFSENLTDLSYRHRGVFLNVVGAL